MKIASGYTRYFHYYEYPIYIIDVAHEANHSPSSQD